MGGVRLGGIGSVAGFGIPYSRTVGSSVGIYTVDEDTGGSPTSAVNILLEFFV